MKRIRLDEEDFRELVNEGMITIDGTTLNFTAMLMNGNLNRICQGEMIEEEDAQIILADIGFDRIDGILRRLI